MRSLADDPTMSRRLARAILHADPQLTLEQRRELISAAEKASTVEELPGWVQELLAGAPEDG